MDPMEIIVRDRTMQPHVASLTPLPFVLSMTAGAVCCLEGEERGRKGRRIGRGEKGRVGEGGEGGDSEG